MSAMLCCCSSVFSEHKNRRYPICLNTASHYYLFLYLLCVFPQPLIDDILPIHPILHDSKNRNCFRCFIHGIKQQIGFTRFHVNIIATIPEACCIISCRKCIKYKNRFFNLFGKILCILPVLKLLKDIFLFSFTSSLPLWAITTLYFLFSVPLISHQFLSMLLPLSALCRFPYRQWLHPALTEGHPLHR